MIKLALCLPLMASLASAATAQSMTPEQIAAMVDERVNAMNPYQDLLNNADPQRSLAAMQIMLESGDDALARMALEFGLLSPNRTVRRAAVEAFLETQPVLVVRFDGDLEWKNYVTIVRQTYEGSVTPEGTGFWRLPVGAHDPEQGCFLQLGTREPTCLVTVNADGIYLTAVSLTGRLEVNDGGDVVGFGSMRAVSESVPITIRLLD